MAIELPACPEGRDDCRIAFASGTFSTAMPYTPVYGRNGQRLNRDPNVRSSSCDCGVCGALWRFSDRDGEPRKWGQPEMRKKVAMPCRSLQTGERLPDLYEWALPGDETA